MATLQDERSIRTTCGSLDSQIDVAMEALRCPPDDAPVATRVGGRTPPRRHLCNCAGSTRDAAAGRADQATCTRKPSPGCNRPDEYRGTILDRHPRPLFPRRHHRLDSRAGSRPGHPLRGQLFRLAGAEAKRLEQEAREDKSRQKTLERDWNGSAPAPRRVRPSRRPGSTPTEEMASQSEREKISRAQIVIPNGPRLGGRVIEVNGLKKGYGDRLLIRRPELCPAAPAHRRRDRPHGAGKSTSLPHADRAGNADEGTVGFGETVQLSYVDQIRDALDRTRPSGKRFRAGPDPSSWAMPRSHSRAYCVGLQLPRAATSEKKVGLLSGGERNRVHMAKLLKSGGNVLLLDEPTNDLDGRDLRALEDCVSSDFLGGCALYLADRSSSTAVHPHPRLRGDAACSEWFGGNFE